jgi:hypothetical protein
MLITVDRLAKGTMALMYEVAPLHAEVSALGKANEGLASHGDLRKVVHCLLSLTVTTTFLIRPRPISRPLTIRVVGTYSTSQASQDFPHSSGFSRPSNLTLLQLFSYPFSESAATRLR